MGMERARAGSQEDGVVRGRGWQGARSTLWYVRSRSLDFFGSAIFVSLVRLYEVSESFAR